MARRRSDEPSIFVSYARAQHEVAQALASWLVAAGYTVWLDATIAGGESWWEEILEQIRGCTVFLACVSPEYLGSEACRKERTYAVACERHVIPLAVTGAAPGAGPFDLSGVQYLRWEVPVRSEDAAALVAALRRLRPRALASPPPRPPAAPLAAFGRAVGEVVDDAVGGPSTLVWVTHAASSTAGLVAVEPLYAGEPPGDAQRRLDERHVGAATMHATSDTLPDVPGEYLVLDDAGVTSVAVGLGARVDLDAAALERAVSRAALGVALHDGHAGNAHLLLSVPGAPGADEIGLRPALHAVVRGLAQARSSLLETGLERAAVAGLELWWRHEDDAAAGLAQLLGLADRGLLPDGVRVERVLARGEGGAGGAAPARAVWRTEVVSFAPAGDGADEHTAVWGPPPPAAAVGGSLMRAVHAELDGSSGASASAALLELLVPRSRILAFLGSGPIRLRCDAAASEVAWEALLFDALEGADPSAPVGLVRDGPAPSGGRGRALDTSREVGVLVVGDDAGCAGELAVLAGAGPVRVERVAGDGPAALTALYERPWRVVHLVGSLGLVDDRPVVMLHGSGGFELAPHALAQMPLLPRFVVVAPGPGASVATGSTAVAARWSRSVLGVGVGACVAPGLAMHSDDADRFLRSMYGLLAAGEAFGDAVAEAQRTSRGRAARAFQCHGLPSLLMR